MYFMLIPKLANVFRRIIREVSDDENDVRANPFDEPALAKPKLPTVGSVGKYQKPQSRSVSAPSRQEEPKSQLQKAYSDFEKRGSGTSTKPVSGTGPKPPYKGSFFGQTWQTNAQVQQKPVSWIDKQTDKRRYGRVASMGKAELVWDGNDWITAAEFNSRYGKR